MPTYARTRVLGEAIQGFLQQTYEGPKELVIFNDRVDQTLMCDAPNVKLVNFSTRYEGLGAKRNALLSVAKYDLVAAWDDDDIYLPERISRGVKLYLDRKPQGYRVSRESHAFQTRDNTNLIVRDAGVMWNVIAERSAIIEVGGSRNVNLNEDSDLLQRLLERRWVYGESATPGMPSFIYRHGNSTPYTHMTVFAEPEDVAAARPGTRIQSAMKNNADALIESGDEPTGVIHIEPQWKKDYTALASVAWNASPLSRK